MNKYRISILMILASMEESHNKNPYNFWQRQVLWRKVKLSKKLETKDGGG